MRESTSACRWKGAVSLVSHGAFSLVDSNNRNADWMAAAASELNDLIPQVVDHAVDLFDHCLGKDLYFYADFDCCDRASGNLIAGMNDGRLSGYELAKCGVTTPRSNASALVLCVENPVFSLDHRFDQFWRTVDSD